MKPLHNIWGDAVDPDDLFLASPRRYITYGELLHFSFRFAESMQPFETKPGAPIGICAVPSDTLVLIIAACWINDIPFISFNPAAPPGALGEQMRRIKLQLLITDREPNTLPDHITAIEVGHFATPHTTTAGEAGAPYDLSAAPENIFGFFFTSGTAGRPKVVPLKRRQAVSAAKSSARNLPLRANKCWLLSLPLYHVGGISIIVRSLLYGSAILRLHPFDSKAVSDCLSNDTRVTAASLVPTMLSRILDNETFRPHGAFRGILLGGGPISPDLLRHCIRRNIPVIPSYGMTETCAQIAANPLTAMPDDDQKLESAGAVFSPNQISIRNEEGRAVQPGRPGTIWLKGPQVFDGYYNTSSRDNFDENGWFNTGDFGRLDTNGNVYIEARRTDLIITGGENVSPFEVEEAIRRIPGVRDAAAFGVPDPEWGQKVVAAVVYTGRKKPSTQEVRRHLGGELENYKLPKEIVEVESLPRTSTGKLKRAELSSDYGGEADQSK